MFITPFELKQSLHDHHEIALLDVREHGQYGESHLFYVVSTPYSNLEYEVCRLVPRKSVRMVLVDEDGGELAALASKRLKVLGYDNISILKGGVIGWKNAGYQLFAGVNLPSKTFGELAEHAFNTPRISAKELNKKIQDKEDLIILDGRPFTEFKKMSIPTAICCPNGELPLRIDDLVATPATTIVINCAGRTRSIIGAQTLINLGIHNKVLALENGTQGWYLEDLQLEHGQSRRHPMQIEQTLIEPRAKRARELAQRHDVQFIDMTRLQSWLDDSTRTTYLCDVRSPEEFASGTLPQARNAPGGQLVQATDQFIGVRCARLVLFDQENVRAPAMASWLAMMGWEVAVLENAFESALKADKPIQSGLSTLPDLLQISPNELASKLQTGATLIDLRSSTAYRDAHIESAVWAIRPTIANLARSKQLTNVILVADTVHQAKCAAIDLRDIGVTNIAQLQGNAKDWQQAGLRLVSTPTQPTNQECVDYLFFVHDRHDGNKAAARQYLAWETNLLNQIDDQERNSYRLPHQS